MNSNNAYANGSCDGAGIPTPSPCDQEVLLDAWRECLGQVLAQRDHEWQERLRVMKAESSAIIAELRANVAEFRSTMEKMIEKRLAQIREPADGPRGEPGPQGEPGAPGKIERVNEYVEAVVHYRGNVVTHGGSTYQARCDTARQPPHEDWTCIARAGENGRDGRSPNVRGTFKAGERYRGLDVVALDGGAFIARRDDPGPCPGDGWQLICQSGKRGQQGPRGERGERGLPGFSVEGWQLDLDRYVLTPILAGGHEGPPANLRPFFEQYQPECGHEQNSRG
jgi:hypothetical protein